MLNKTLHDTDKIVCQFNNSGLPQDPEIRSNCYTGDIVTCHFIYQAVVWGIFVGRGGGIEGGVLKQTFTNQSPSASTEPN